MERQITTERKVTISLSAEEAKEIVEGLDKWRELNPSISYLACATPIIQLVYQIRIGYYEL